MVAALPRGEEAQHGEQGGEQRRGAPRGRLELDELANQWLAAPAAVAGFASVANLLAGSSPSADGRANGPIGNSLAVADDHARLLEPVPALRSTGLVVRRASGS